MSDRGAEGGAMGRGMVRQGRGMTGGLRERHRQAGKVTAEMMEGSVRETDARFDRDTEVRTVVGDIVVGNTCDVDARPAL